MSISFNSVSAFEGAPPFCWQLIINGVLVDYFTSLEALYLRIEQLKCGEKHE